MRSVADSGHDEEAFRVHVSWVRRDIHRTLTIVQAIS